MKAFNPEKELNKIQKGNKKKIILFIISLLVIGIIEYSFALYQVRYSKRIIYTKVAPFSNSDLDIAIYVNGERKTEAPNKDDGYVYTALLCDKNYTGSVTWDYENKTLSLSQVQMPIPNKCNVYFVDSNTNNTQEFQYTGDVQEYNVPKNGAYKIELWGASGGENISSGNTNRNYGLGGYTSGIIALTKDTKLYFYVGEKGKIAKIYNGQNSGTSYNGGGAGVGANDNDDGGGGGGGATDVRLIKGTTWDDFDSLKSRIMVAGAGAGGPSSNYLVTYIAAGSGGGLTGVGDSYHWSDEKLDTRFNATQTTGYNFGIGENGYVSRTGGSGAGGGYYGGKADNISGYRGGGGGGSSFISGHPGCNAIDNEQSTDINTIVHTGSPNHYSGKVFTNTVMIDGLGYLWTDKQGSYIGMPTFDGTNTMKGNDGNGHAKITFLG